MKNKQFALFAILQCLLTYYSNANTIYVSAAATGNGTGSSWANACTTIQAGLAAAIPGDQVWVRTGVYRTTTTTDRNLSFNLVSGISLYGGFIGTESFLSQRDWVANPTTLSGDIGTLGVSSDNAYHVVKATNVSSGTIFDGFKVVSGYANGVYDYGGGFYNQSGSPTIKNCTFQNNFAAQSGGAISHWTSGNITIENCIIKNNNTNGQGGGVEFRAGICVMSDCEISDNQAGSGGGVYCYGGNITTNRCVISGNSASSNGGGIYHYYNSTTNLYNSLIVGNMADGSAAQYLPPISNSNTHTIINCVIAHNKNIDQTSLSSAFIGNASTSVYNCVFWENLSPKQLSSVSNVKNSLIQGGFTGGTNISTNNPLFIAPGSSNNAPFSLGNYNYHFSLFSPAIDAGNNTFAANIANYDLDRLPRIYPTKIDLGCYENPYCVAAGQIASSTGSFNLCQGNTTTLSVAGNLGAIYSWSTGATSPSINVSSEANYTIFMVDTAGCLVKDTAYIIYLPASVTLSGVAAFCPNSFTTITASGNNTNYEWSDGQTGNSVMFGIAGTYIVTATATNGCPVTDSITITQATNPQPFVIVNGGVLSTGNFASYQWLLNGQPIAGATSNNYITPTNGNYSVTVTNTTGCIGTSSTVNVTTANIDDALLAINMRIFPNPTQHSFTLQTTNKLTQPIHLTILNALGQTIGYYPFFGELNISVEHWAKGIYYLLIENEGKMKSYRITVE